MMSKGLRIGLLGAHNTGKTLLAETLSKRLGLPFVQTTTSGVFAKRGVDPAAPMDIQTRVSLQEDVLIAASALWSEGDAHRQGFVTDRTPVDMASYLLCDLQGSTDLSQDAVDDYLAACMDAVDAHFDVLIQVSPGIPLTARAGKAAPAYGYVEHLHFVARGLMVEWADMFCLPSVTLPRNRLSLDERVKFALDFLTESGRIVQHKGVINA